MRAAWALSVVTWLLVTVSVLALVAWTLLTVNTILNEDDPYITVQDTAFTRTEYTARIEEQIERLGPLEVCIGAAAVAHRYECAGLAMTTNDERIWEAIQEACEAPLRDSPQ